MLSYLTGSPKVTIAIESVGIRCVRRVLATRSARRAELENYIKTIVTPFFVDRAVKASNDRKLAETIAYQPEVAAIAGSVAVKITADEWNATGDSAYLTPGMFSYLKDLLHAEDLVLTWTPCEDEKLFNPTFKVSCETVVLPVVVEPAVVATPEVATATIA